MENKDFLIGTIQFKPFKEYALLFENKDKYIKFCQKHNIQKTMIREFNDGSILCWTEKEWNEAIERTANQMTIAKYLLKDEIDKLIAEGIDIKLKELYFNAKA